MTFSMMNLRLVTLLVFFSALMTFSVTAQIPINDLPKKVEQILKTDLKFTRPYNNNSVVTASNPEMNVPGGKQESVRVKFFHSAEQAKTAIDRENELLLKGENRQYEKGVVKNFGAQDGVIAVMSPSSTTVLNIGFDAYPVGGATVTVQCGQLYLAIGIQRASLDQSSSLGPGVGSQQTRDLGKIAFDIVDSYADKVFNVFARQGFCQETEPELSSKGLAVLMSPDNNPPWCRDHASGYIDQWFSPPSVDRTKALARVSSWGGKVESIGDLNQGDDFMDGDGIEIPQDPGWGAVVHVWGTAILHLEPGTKFTMPCDQPTTGEQIQHQIKLEGGVINFIWNSVTNIGRTESAAVQTKDAVAGIKDLYRGNRGSFPPINDRDRSAFSVLTGWGSNTDGAVGSGQPPEWLAAKVPGKIDFTVNARDGKTRIIVRSGNIYVTPTNRSLKPFELHDGQEATVSQTVASPITAIKGGVVAGEIKDDQGKTIGLVNKTVPAVTANASSCPVASWSGDTGAGDAQGKNNGAMLNGLAFEAGKSGMAFSLDGVNDFVRVPDSPGLDLFKELTIDAWIKVEEGTSGAGQVILSKYIGADGMRGYELAVVDQKLRLLALSQGEAQTCNLLSASEIDYGKWTHVAGTINAKECRVYIDGKLEGTAPGLPSIQQNNNPLYLGVHGNSEIGYFNGLIDEVELYDRALSAADIAAIYAAGGAKRKCGAGGTATGVVGGPVPLLDPSTPLAQFPMPTTSVPMANFAGNWDTQHAFMVLKQVGAHVTGEYYSSGGKIEGVVTGNALRFTWTQTNDRRGTGTFYMQPDGKSFTGHWSYTTNPDDKSGGGWAGTRRN